MKLVALIFCIVVSPVIGQRVSAPTSNVKLMSQILDLLSSDPRGSTDNVIFSPASLLTSMALLYEGMDDPSRALTRNAFGFPANHQQFLREFGRVAKHTSDAKTALNMAVVAQQAQIKNEYGTSIKKNFGAQAFRWNFEANTIRAMKSVNAKVRNTTKGAIPRFLDQGDLSAATRILLINVMHIKSDWAEKFDVETTDGTFSTPQGDRPVEMMFAQFEQGAHETLPDGAQILSLPLKDPNYEMVFVLPPEGTDVNEYARNNIDNSNLMSRVLNPESLPKTRISVEMPKFKITKKFALKSVLRQIPGVAPIFQPGRVAFSNLANGKLTVDEVYHVASVDVNQNGVEAAAATGVSVTLYSAFGPDVFMTFNRPFLFFLVEKPTKMILFSGIVTNPSNDK